MNPRDFSTAYRQAPVALAELVACTADGGHVPEPNLRRALDDAKTAAVVEDVLARAAEARVGG